MAGLNPSDPFLEVQSDVLTLLSSTRTTFSSYLRIRSLTASSSHVSPELVQSRTELLSNLDTLRSDLEDLLESIRAVENDPYSFGLDTAEVQRRRAFIQQTGAEVQSMAQEINTGTGQQHIGDKGLPNPSQFDDDRTGEDEDDPYAEFEQQQQETMFREQDEQLDDITNTVGRLRGQAADMGRELEEQTGILDEVEVVADRVGGKLQGGLKRVGEIVRKNEEKWSSCCIGVLIFVLILMLVLLIII